VQRARKAQRLLVDVGPRVAAGALAREQRLDLGQCQVHARLVQKRLELIAARSAVHDGSVVLRRQRLHLGIAPLHGGVAGDVD